MSHYRARDIAHYIVDKCTRDGIPISNLQLQKIMYLLQVVYCRITGNLLFYEEFEAWQYGPVLPRVYDEFSFFGGIRINKEYEDTIQLAPFDADIVNTTVEELRMKYPWDLVNITHASGSPWSRVWRNGDGNRETIGNDLIIRFCSKG